jgi:hypothetical protein
MEEMEEFGSGVGDAGWKKVGSGIHNTEKKI